MMKAKERSPERAALAEAIARFQEREREAAAIDAALDEARSAFYRAESALQAAEQAMVTAQNNAGAHLVAKHLGTTAEGKTLAQARADLQAAQDHVTETNSAYRALQTKQKEGTGRALAHLYVTDAVRDVILADPATVEVLAAYDRAQAEAMRLGNIAERLIPHFQPANRPRGTVPAAPDVNAWSAAIKALETDPDTPLPKVTA